MTNLITPRPIAQLTSKMGMVLLIGDSGCINTPTRAEVGYRDESGQIRTYDGDHFTDGGEAATSFIDIPYDETAANALGRNEAA